MEPKPIVVVIIGSTRFKQHHLGYAQKLTLQGKIALTSGFYHHVDNFPITTQQKEMIDRLMLARIDLSDEVLVVNINGYIGESTGRAIKYAHETNKRVTFVEDPSGPFASWGSDAAAEVGRPT